MTDQSIGTARLDIVVDTTNMEAGVERAKRAQDGLTASGERAARTQEVNSKRNVAALEKNITLMGASREEQLRWRIAQQTSGETAARLNKQLDAQAAKLAAGAAQFNRFGLSAKQQAAALRGVPAQLTDIFTSLASGQRPITVLLQQGGQLKDMFGGVVPAVRALGGALVGLINPLTIAAAASAALFFAWKQGSDEAVGFRQAIALTGDVAGTTADEMQAMALAISSNVGTQHQAAAALAEVAKSGKFAGEQLRLVAETAVAMEKATGQAVSTTVAEFAKFRGDPVKALVELNDQYHFLTIEVFEQVKALQAQGREEEALSVAIKSASNALTDRANEVVANAGYMERAWRGLKAVVVTTWDAIRDAGRASTAMTDAQMKIASANSELNALSNRIKTFTANGGIYTPEREKRDRAEIARLVKVKQDAAKVIADDPASKAARQRASAQRAQEAAISLDQEATAFDSAVEKLTKRREAALGKMNEAVALAGNNDKLVASIKEDGKKIVAALDEQIAEAQKRADKADAGAGRATGGGGRARASTPVQRALPSIDTKAAQAELERLAEAEARATESFRDLEAQLQGPLAVAIRDHEKRVAELNALAAQSPEAAARLNAALELEAERHREVAEAIEAEADPMKNLLAGMAEELDMIGLSNTERAVMLELRRQNIDLMSAEGQAAMQQARQFDQMAIARENTINLMDEFRRGTSDALADIVTGSKSAKDAITDFFDNLARAATQAIADQWMQKLFGSFGTSGQGTSGGNWLGAIFGALFGGGSSGNSMMTTDAFAKGAGFSGGVQYFARGDVFDRPTAFGMRNGIGVMGEAGPEAVMPLKRGPDGSLGVQVVSEPRRVMRSGDTNIYVQGAPNKQTLKQLERANGRGARREMARTGS